MITEEQCLKTFGYPTSNSDQLILFRPLESFRKMPACPRVFLCHKLLIVPITNAFWNIISSNSFNDFIEWNGCFNIRQSRAGNGFSLHSWGLAIDINASQNPYLSPPAMPKKLVECFTDAGFDWGGHFHHPDGMHFQLSSLPAPVIINN